MSDLVVELKNLKKSFRTPMTQKKSSVVNNLSCGFARGQCTGFLGHNGAGKTTTLKMMMGLIKPESGDILFNGKKIQREDRARIGYMAESDRLPMTLNALEVLNLHLRMMNYKGEAKPIDLIKKGLDQVNLWESRKIRLGKMSKGMRRRVAWVMATIHSPDLFILDEPFSGLDPVARRDMCVWINELKASQKSIIMCTHELWTMTLLCDQVHIMKKGDLVYSSYEHPGSGINFKLSFSGTDVAGVKKIATDLKLSDPTFMNQSGYLVELAFKDYASANQYLKAGLQAGLVLTDFSSSKVVSEAEAVRYF